MDYFTFVCFDKTIKVKTKRFFEKITCQNKLYDI